MKTTSTHSTHSVQSANSGTANTGLWPLVIQQRRRYLLAVMAMILGNASLFVVPLAGKFAIDRISSGDPEVALPGLAWLIDTQQADSTGALLAYLWASAAVVVAMTALAGICQFLRGRLIAEASELIAEAIRQALYDGLHCAQARFFDQSDTGDLVQRCSSDVDTVRLFLSSHIVEIARAILLWLTVTPVLIWMDVRLAALSLCLMPLLAVGAYVFFGRVRTLFKQVDEAEAALTGTLQENLSGMRVVRAFHRQAHEIERFAADNARHRQCQQRMAGLLSVYWGLSDLLAVAQMGLVLLLGGMLVSRGTLSVGDLFAFTTYVGMVIWPVRHLGQVLADAGKAQVAAGRIDHILKQPAELPGDVPVQRQSRGAIQIKQLSVAYATDAPALHDISVTLEPGAIVGIVGTPGAGKTTLVRTLLKLCDYQSGSVTIDGRELRELDRHWLRQQMAVVFQEPFLFARTVSENLLHARDGASMEEQIQACNSAAVHSAVMQFSKGYNTRIGERGVTLSGGQRQRLALARALLKSAPILLLDDCLSAVDSQTEHTILSALYSMHQRPTTLIIAHRLSTVRQADRILVLDEGRLVQQGSHAELAATPGVYQRLCNIQYAQDVTVNQELSA